MSSGAERLAPIARGVQALRAPLSRVELAASRLLHQVPSPLAHDLARAIRSAVGEIDAGIETTLHALEPRPPRARDSVPCRAHLERTLAGLQPVLDARGTPCKLAEGDARGDPSLVRQGALKMIGAALHLAPPGGRLELRLRERAGRIGVSLRLHGATAADPASAERALGELASFGMAHAGGLEVAAGEPPSPSDTTWVLWLPGAGAQP